MKIFTVTVAGPERFDGEAPYTWVVEATDMASATNKALAYHALSEDRPLHDLEIVPLHTFEGPPPENCGYHWNDLRPLPGSAPNGRSNGAATTRFGRSTPNGDHRARAYFL
ncbi:hypothetical protein GBF35_47305 [Nonomuraea phyllanthi]|uniref:hypothetical protein n=1 Tax=Nonomuraea phyllanthi TaxID=2219224 RepID=UPI0012937327|nr:hypothetical protein [Nonomuraea phyllanthi]QFY13171.1 hypothetical protein GBF35_47305 [Nonomuraea phyllanthi]